MHGFANPRPDAASEKVYLKHLVDVFPLPDGKSVKVRFIGPVHSLCWHWFQVERYAGGCVRFPKLCLSGGTEEFAKDVCPYCDAGVQRSTQLLSNAIIRDLQHDRPRRQPDHTRREQREVKMLGYRCHLKDPRSLSWTPIRVLEIPSSLALEINNLVPLNKHKGKVYPLSHPDYGMDVKVKRDFTETGFVNYSARRARDRRLTQEEIDYLIYPLDMLRSVPPEHAKLEWKKIEPRLVKNNHDEKKHLADKPIRNRNGHSLIDKRQENDVNEIINVDLARRNKTNNCSNRPRRPKPPPSKMAKEEKRSRPGIVCGMEPLFG